MKVICGNCHRELQIPQCLPGTMLMCPLCKQWTQVPTSSADQWFVARNKQKLGPFSFEQLRQQASTGKLQPAEMLLKEGTAKWIAASVAGGLFPPASAQVRSPATIANSTHAPEGREKVPAVRAKSSRGMRLARAGALLAAIFAAIVVIGVVSTEQKKIEEPVTPAKTKEPVAPAAPEAVTPKQETVSQNSTTHILSEPPKPPEYIKLEGTKGKIQQIVFSPDGSTLATAGDDHTIKLWDLSTRHSQIIAEDNKAPLDLQYLLYAHDGKKLAAVMGSYKDQDTNEGIIRIYDTGTGKLINQSSNMAGIGFARYRSRDNVVVFDNTGNADASGIHTYNLETGQDAADKSESPLSGHMFFSLSPNGERAATWKVNHSSTDITVYDLANNKPIITDASARLMVDETFVFSASIPGMAFSNDGARFAYLSDCAGMRRDTITWWDLKKNEKRASSFPEGITGVWLIDFSPTGNFVVTNSHRAFTNGSYANQRDEDKVQLWDFATGELIFAVDGDITYGWKSSCFSPDEKVLFVRDNNGIRCIDVKSGKVITTPYSEMVKGCSIIKFSNDGQLLAGADESGGLYVQKLPEGSKPRK